MRTKALLGVAALVTGIASSALAQSNVYSLNVVGYYNVTVNAGQKLIIANQLNTTNNTIGVLLAPPMVDNNDLLFKYSGGFAAYQYSTDDGAWLPDGNATLNPGEAAFFQPVGARTLTFVGEVLQGSLTNTLPLGVKVLRSSKVPQAGLVTTTLGLPAANNDNLFTFAGGYTAYQYSDDDGAWLPSEPNINVGQGFFYTKSPTAPTPNWVRNFTVQ